MHTKSGFNLRDVCGEKLILAEGIENINFSRVIRFNQTSAYLWENIKDKEFTVEDLTTLLTDTYDVDREQAFADASDLAKKWIESGIVEE